MPSVQVRAAKRAFLVLALALFSCEKPAIDGPACGVSEFIKPVAGNQLRHMDVLFVVDASPSIAPHLARLRAAMPDFFAKLTDVEHAEDTDFSFRDLNIGVISSDMGAGSPAADGCSAGGDDGLLVGRPTCTAGGFVWYYDGYHDRAETLASIDCALAQIGSGCAITQPLEATLKALLSSTDDVGFADGARGHGDRENAGFRRPDSQLLIVIVTDRDDCSGVEPDALARGDVSAAHCMEHPELLASVERYYRGYRSFSALSDIMVVLLAGVPPDLVQQNQPIDFTVDQQRQAFYDRVLGDARLQFRSAPALGSGLPELAPSCMAGSLPTYPPRRLLEYMRASNQEALRIASLCDADLASSLFAALNSDFGEPSAPCVTLALPRNADGFVPCQLIWELPATPDPARPLTPTMCEERPDILSIPSDGAAQRSSRGTALCDVRQVPVLERGVAPGESDGQGFYIAYGPSLACPKELATVAHTPGAIPPEGVRLSLHCFDDAQHYDNGSGVLGAALGDPCDTTMVDALAPTLTSDVLCNAVEQNGRPLEDRFCHPDKHVCVRGCLSDDECPRDWICDSGTTQFSATAGRPICINPSCGGP